MNLKVLAIDNETMLSTPHLVAFMNSRVGNLIIMLCSFSLGSGLKSNNNTLSPNNRR